MKLTLNDRPVVAAPEDGDTLESLLDGLRGRGAIRNDEVVVELCVDSRPWQAGDMDGLATTRLADLSEVAIATDDLQGYGRRILADARGMWGILEQAVPRVADAFRTRTPEEANDALFNLLNALQQLLGCLYMVRNTTGIRCDAAAAPEGLLAEVAACLSDIQAAQESKDWPALAGLLDDELLPVLGGFDGVLQDMIHAT